MSTTTLAVWHYDTAMGAAAGEVRLKDLQQQGAVRVVDTITVTWVPGAEEPHLGHLLRHGAASIARASMLGALVGSLLDQRQSARAAKDFATADAIRDQIKAAGIEVEDTPTGASWSLR